MGVAEVGDGEGLAVHLAPGVPDVGDHHGDDYRDVAHCLEGEFARRGIGDGERTIVGCVVVACEQEHYDHHQNSPPPRPLSPLPQ